MSRPRAKGSYVRKTVSLPAATVERLEGVLADDRGKTMSSLVTEAVESWLKTYRSPDRDSTANRKT